MGPVDIEQSSTGSTWAPLFLALMRDLYIPKESWKTSKKHQLGKRIKNVNEMRHVSYESDYLALLRNSQRNEVTSLRYGLVIGSVTTMVLNACSYLQQPRSISRFLSESQTAFRNVGTWSFGNSFDHHGAKRQYMQQHSRRKQGNESTRISPSPKKTVDILIALCTLETVLDRIEMVAPVYRTSNLFFE